MTFPLIRTKWTNEHVMTALLGVIILYNLPVWVQSPAGLLHFAALIGIALILDAGLNFSRYRKPTCAVSAAVTAAVLYTLAPQIPLEGLILGTVAGLAFGKHAFGGTGKNFVNPAILGYLIIALVFKPEFPLFQPSWLLLPGILLGIPFMVFRPFASSGLVVGMLLQLVLRQELTLEALVAYGIIFIACIVVTDPVTVTDKPYISGVGGFITGFVMLISPSPVNFCLPILGFNLLSRIADMLIYQPVSGMRVRLKLPRPAAVKVSEAEVMDLIEDKAQSELEFNVLDAMEPTEFLRILEKAGVFGQGGAGFPTWRKLDTLLKSNAADRHLIVNGVECDPGLIHDKWLLLNKSEMIGQGMALLKQIAGFKTVTLAVKSADGLSFAPDIAICQVPYFYPAGAERTLIKEVLGIGLHSGDIPSQKGILVLNVQTVLSIYDAVYFDKRADTRYLTVSNLFTGESRIARVRLGDKIRDISEKVFNASVNVFSGGGMMQARLARDDDVVDTGTNYIATGRFPNYKESPLCSRCGNCVRYCPEGLDVRRIAKAVDDGDAVGAKKYHPERCLSCGSCSYVCLAGRNLSDKVMGARDAIRSKPVKP
jgi:electron transport complex protein RnfC